MRNLQGKIKKLPAQPGVYFFKDKSGEIIYIGKSVNLKNRVKSYWQAKNLGLWTKKMVSQIADIAWQKTSSEFTALLFEVKLINKHQPEYNLQSKDDKSFLSLAISDEDYPRVFTTRTQEEVRWCFGPFPSTAEVRQVVKVLRKIFPFRSCRRLGKKPCLYYHLNLCPGCCLGFPKAEYKKNIKKIVKFVNGNINGLVKQLKKEMKQASQNQRFEKAAELKKQIEAINYVVLNWQSLGQEALSIGLAADQPEQILKEAKKILRKIKSLGRIEAYDVSNFYGRQAAGSMVVFENLIPAKDQYRRFKIRGKFEPDDVGMIEEVFQRRFGHLDWSLPGLLVVDGGRGQVGAVFSALKEKKLAGEVPVLGLTKKEEIIIKPILKSGLIIGWQEIRLAQDSQFLKLLKQVRDESHRFAKKYHLYLRKKKFKV